MAGWTFVNYLAAGLVLIPLLSSILGMLVFRGGLVIANEDLVGWVLHPIGLAYVLSAGALAIAGGVIRYAGLFRILIDDIDGRKVSLKQTVIELAPDVPALLKLCAISIALAFALLTPLLAVLGVVYLVLLRAHDINYYLAEAPPEWTSALVLAGSLFLVWLVPAAYVILRTLPALPAFLDGYRPVRRAIRESWMRTQGDAARALWLFALCVVLWNVVRVSLHGTYALLAAPVWRLLDETVTSVTPLLLATIVWATGTFVIDIIVSFIGFSIAATVLTKFYLEDTDLHKRAPAIPLGLKALPRRAGARLLRWLNPIRLAPAFAAVVLISAIASAFLLRPLTDEVHFEIAAHRAGAFIGVENTLATLERAIDYGADYAEVDLQLTADSVVVVVHDADMMRLAGDPRRIADLTLDQIRDLRLIAPDGAPDDELRLATLDEYLARSRGRIGLMLELKYYGFDEALAPATIATIREHQMEDEVVIISLSTRALEQVHRLAPDLRTGFLATVAAGDITRLPVDVLGVARPLATRSLVRSAHRSDMQIFVWTLNTVSTMLAAVDRGADGVITDDPALAVALRTELASLSPPERLILRLRNLLPDMDTYLTGADVEQ